MNTFFLTCTAIGGVLLLLQLVLGVAGADHHDTHAGHELPSDGLQLLSMRALSAGVAFFGVGGLAASRAGWPLAFVMIAAVLPGVAAMFGVAVTMRAMLRMERDATVRIDGAIGLSGTVYVPVPAARAGVGKVHLMLQGRTVEYQAVTPDERVLETGAAIVVVDVRDESTVEVVSLPSLDGVVE